MAVEVITQIKSAEERARQIRAKAHEESRKLIKAAGEKQQDAISSAVEVAKESAAGIIREAEENAEKEIALRKLENDRDCEKIKDAAQSKMDKAAAFILGRIVNTYGHSRDEKNEPDSPAKG